MKKFEYQECFNSDIYDMDAMGQEGWEAIYIKENATSLCSYDVIYKREIEGKEVSKGTFGSSSIETKL